MKNEQPRLAYLGDPYSPTYAVARDRFREAAREAGARLEKISLDPRGPSGEELSIDLAFLGDPAARSTIVVSSGLHGVEGFFGSAVQVFWMGFMAREPDERPGDDTSVVLIHAINPYGFAWRRRCDEQNIDLNRNYLWADEPYAGAPPGYAELDDLLNPPSPPTRLEGFRLGAVWRILRQGMKPLKTAIAVGQYEYPSGLFYGGAGPAASTRIVQQNFSRWIGDAQRVVHIDLHTGLGRPDSYKLLVPPAGDSTDHDWYAETFGADRVETVGDEGIAYPARGVMGAWLRSHLADRDYRFLVAEFGTHSSLRVLSALRSENRAHHHSEPGEPAYERAKRELVECFWPRSSKWRDLRVVDGLMILVDALAAVER